MEFSTNAESCFDVDVITLSLIIKNIIYSTNTTDTHRPPILTNKIYEISKFLLENMYTNSPASNVQVTYALSRVYDIVFTSRHIARLDDPTNENPPKNTFLVEHSYIMKHNNTSVHSSCYDPEDSPLKKRKLNSF